MIGDRKPRILFAGGGTGGHLYPALALAEAFQAREGGAEIFFLGARRGIEAKVLPERGVPHELLPFEPIRRARPWENWRLIPALAKAAVGISKVFKTFQPDLVVGTGGYASGPVVAWGVLKGVPTAIQEQNSYPGITTRLLSKRVRQIHLAFPEALDYLRPGKKTEVFQMGNPIRPPDASIDRTSARQRFSLGEGPVALVVGGSQGARAINEALLQDLKEVAEGRAAPRPPGFEILWATGPNHQVEVEAELEELGLQDWVHAEGYITEMPLALASADVAVSRAGAMALAELCAWGIPSVIIPFPHAAANHQHHNAQALANAAAAVMIPESELTAGRLWDELVDLAGDAARREELASRAKERGHPEAAREMVEQLVKLV